MSKGGRDCCRMCWGRGPHCDDWVDYLRHIALLDELVRRNVDMRYQRYLAAFVLSVGGDRKAWSYHGVLPIRDWKDYRTSRCPRSFDPSNLVYAEVCSQAAPDLQELCRWPFPPNICTLGDCIECLLAYDDAKHDFQAHGVNTPDAANFFREMSYSYWRVHRVLSWNSETRKLPWLVGAKMKDVVHRRTKWFCFEWHKKWPKLAAEGKCREIPGTVLRGARV